MIPRPDYIKQIKKSFRIHPVTALLGSRQCGKTTLARLISEKQKAEIFDLENPKLDLMVMAGGNRYGFEFKYADAPGR